MVSNGKTSKENNLKTLLRKLLTQLQLTNSSHAKFVWSQNELQNS